MVNLRAIEDQEPRRLVDEDTDQQSHPLFRRSPGMKMLGARGREGIKRYRRRNERFLRNEIQYFQEIIQTTFQNVETYTNPQPGQPMGRRWMTGDGRGSKAKGPVSKSEAVICPGKQDRVNPGPALPPHRTGRRLRGTKGKQPRSSSLARMSASATPTPVHQDDRQQVLHKDDTEQQHECTEPKGHKTDRFVTESQHPRDYDIRSQKETEIDDPSFMLQPAAT